MAKKKAAAKSTALPVDAHKHVADKRSNIPTRETAAFADDDGPQSFVVHRDRSLDPQFVWKGKDEQDAKPLEVCAVPIHVHEKIHPRVIVEDVKRRAARPQGAGTQRDLFADFNGLDDFQKKLEFYQHDLHWSNRLILGDSLLVMASLAEKERLRGQVHCIYFDPSYGIKFGSNWQVSTAQARRQGRQGRGPHAPAGADQGVSRYVGTRYSQLSDVSARPPDRGAGSARGGSPSTRPVSQWRWPVPRLMAARFPYYLLTDSVEGLKKQAELTGTPTDPGAPAPRRDLHKGFVYKTVPHVTRKSIANNPDIAEGMTREQGEGEVLDFIRCSRVEYLIDDDRECWREYACRRFSTLETAFFHVCIALQT